MEKQIKMKVKRVSKIIALVLAGIIILPLAAIFLVRGINAIRFNIRDGVQERIFVTLGGIEQALHIRGENENNPVIIWLHGGPGWSDAYELATWQYKMENDFTFIRWDQRGSGRTYRRNPGAPLSFDILIQDLYELVNYANERFGQPVYIVGDSWGTVLGITYASLHPESISGFVGVAQNIDMHESLRMAFETAYDFAREAGNTRDAEEMRAVYERAGNRSFADADFDFIDFVLYQSLPANYLAVRGESQGFGIFFSPWFGVTEFREWIGVMRNNRLFFDRNRPLFYYLLDTFIPPDRLEVPVAFIMGSEDFITNTGLVVDYYNRVEAPSRRMFIIEGSGHSPYRSQPEVFTEMLRKALSGFNLNTATTQIGTNLAYGTASDQAPEYYQGSNSEPMITVRFYYHCTETDPNLYALPEAFLYITEEITAVEGFTDDFRIRMYEKTGLRISNMWFETHHERIKLYIDLHEDAVGFFDHPGTARSTVNSMIFEKTILSILSESASFEVLVDGNRGVMVNHFSFNHIAIVENGEVGSG